MNKKNINRLEIIDHSKEGDGREFVKWDDDVDFFFDYQDNKKTLKIFIKDNNKN